MIFGIKFIKMSNIIQYIDYYLNYQLLFKLYFVDKIYC